MKLAFTLLATLLLALPAALRTAEPANDPKLSDGGGRRSLCGKVAGGE